MNNNLKSALRKSKWDSNREFFYGCLLPSEMLELVKIGAKFREEHSRQLVLIKRDIKCGISIPTWYYFIVKKELRKLIENSGS